jgi:hypothetical protein
LAEKKERKTLTIDERIERLEHVVAGHIEQAKKDYEENRRFVRESREDWQRELRESRERWEQQLRESKEAWDREMNEMRTEMAARDKVTDKRISDLVLAIRDLIERMNGGKK